MTIATTFLSTDRPDSRTVVHWFACRFEDAPEEVIEMGILTQQGEEGTTVRLVDCDGNPDADHEIRFARVKNELTSLTVLLLGVHLPCQHTAVLTRKP